MTNPPSEAAPPDAHDASPAEIYHLAHEDHDHDPTNPHFFGLPIGVIIAGVIAAGAVCVTLARFFL